MRVLLILPVLAMAAGCDGRRISGPEAQRVVVQVKTAHTSVTSAPLIFVDGVRLVSGRRHRTLIPPRSKALRS